jgi:ADP-ribose pyrophosphatase YjhB (NUDIX family)/predicted transcriptional regulator
MQQLHKAQLSILQTLRHSESAKYSLLMRPLDMESDVFKFHVHKLQKLAYIKKLSSGEYVLTAAGKEFANNLDKKKRITQKQPKHSLLLVVSKTDVQGSTVYLFQQRLRHPHWGYWGFMSGPLKWGIDAEITAKKELEKQTGLIADFRVASFYRQRDYEPESGDLLEDKLFYIMQTDVASGTLKQDYAHGQNAWMTLEELERLEKHFEPTREVAQMLQANKTYFSLDVERKSADF